MKITAKIDYEHKTCSGKPSIDFQCEHCHLSYIGHSVDGYFWQTTLDKTNLQSSLEKFLSAINEGNTEYLFIKNKTGKKLLKVLCHCDKNVTCIEYHRSVKRAREILNAALHQISKKEI